MRTSQHIAFNLLKPPTGASPHTRENPRLDAGTNSQRVRPHGPDRPHRAVLATCGKGGLIYFSEDPAVRNCDRNIRYSNKPARNCS